MPLQYVIPLPFAWTCWSTSEPLPTTSQVPGPRGLLSFPGPPRKCHGHKLCCCSSFEVGGELGHGPLVTSNSRTFWSLRPSTICPLLFAASNPRIQGSRATQQRLVSLSESPQGPSLPKAPAPVWHAGPVWQDARPLGYPLVPLRAAWLRVDRVRVILHSDSNQGVNTRADIRAEVPCTSYRPVLIRKVAPPSKHLADPVLWAKSCIATRDPSRITCPMPPRFSPSPRLRPCSEGASQMAQLRSAVKSRDHSSGLRSRSPQ